jgi:hypothetical protein
MQPMDENRLLTHVLGLEKLEASGSKNVGAEEIYLIIEPMLKVGDMPRLQRDQFARTRSWGRTKYPKSGNRRTTMLAIVSSARVSLLSI